MCVSQDAPQVDGGGLLLPLFDFCPIEHSYLLQFIRQDPTSSLRTVRRDPTEQILDGVVLPIPLCERSDLTRSLPRAKQDFVLKRKVNRDIVP